MESRQLIRNYILENFLFTDDPSAIADDVSFLEQGIIDSVGALEIALFIEANFGFAVGDEEMLPKNLDSINNLVAFVDRKGQKKVHLPSKEPARAVLVAG
jgi:acyl carrier protein